jgi:hypothetical protein
MNLNPQIWQQTIEAAKAATAGSPAWLRAIDKAAEQIESNPCITELVAGVLITSPSGNTYLANGKCRCKAYSFGQACWHRAAAQLLNRYNEALNAPAPPKPADERAGLIAGIKAAWSRKYPRESLADNLMARFRCNNLEALNTDFLRRIQGALEAK